MDDLIARHREGILKIAAQHGASSIRVFGSRLRGTQGPISDLDLLVEMAPQRTLLDLIAIKQDLEDLLACQVDVLTEAALSPYLRDQVLAEARAL